MADIVPPPTVYRDHCYTARVVTARKRHRCDIGDHYPYPCLAIEPGDKYVRSTVFPGHDSLGSWWDKGARPLSHAVCLNCARNYTGLDTLAKGVGA